MEFIESSIFTRRADKIMTRDELRSIQNEIAENLAGGVKIMKKTHKRRFAAKGHGKRGGCRIIYWYSGDERFVHLLFIFAKNEQDNLTDEQMRDFRKVIGALEEVYDG
ncbi:MAG: type II toxin-antitoxin system RelE/ParE family toxin [Planctomycetes bacterium]|nr:type II toxin-antitoxin system RelE/ParE family toxin [Planctomycetota bacterium]